MGVFIWDIEVQLGGQTQSILGKLGILVTIYLFSWDTEVFFCGVCLLHRRMMAFSFIFNDVTRRYFQSPRKLRCFVEWLSILEKTTILYLLLAPEHLNSWVNEPALISGKMTWEKKSVSCENNLFIQNRSANAHNMEIWQKRTPYFQIFSQCLLMTKSYSYT